jgi:hypothetical protein
MAASPKASEHHPDGKANNWMQTVSGQSFFDKTWRPIEIEPI